jgi:hypothetical protein
LARNFLQNALFGEQIVLAVEGERLLGQLPCGVNFKKVSLRPNQAVLTDVPARRPWNNQRRKEKPGYADRAGASVTIRIWDDEYQVLLRYPKASPATLIEHLGRDGKKCSADISSIRTANDNRERNRAKGLLW